MHLVGLYTYCKMMHGAYSVKNVKAFIVLNKTYRNDNLQRLCKLLVGCAVNNLAICYTLTAIINVREKEILKKGR